VDGLVRLVPPSRRRHARHVMERLRSAWIGWMQGVVFDMFISGTLLYVGLRIVGLEFAILFAVLTALLVVIPYFGAIVGAIPPVLFAFTDSPGKALAVLVVYVLVQQIESNLIVPLVMSRTTRLHPALIAIGVVVVGNLFGIVGLFVAVPIVSAVVILTEEIWVREIEAAHAQRTTADIALARPEEPLPERPDPGRPPAELAGAPQRDPELGAVDAGRLGVPALGLGPVERHAGREGLAGDVVGVLTHGRQQRVVAEQGQLDAVLHLQSRALAGDLDSVHDLACCALPQQLLVQVRPQCHRVVGLALEVVPTARQHHERQVLRAQ
jgi:hypothetical protein